MHNLAIKRPGGFVASTCSLKPSCRTAPKFRPSWGMHQGSGVNSHPDGSESVALKLRREVRDEALHLFSAALPVLNCLTFGNRC